MVLAPLEGWQGSRYRVLRRLKEGGSADIFLAESLVATHHREKYVVAKRMRGVGEHREALSSFDDEAHLIARLVHPGIARLLDIAMSPEGMCLILECLHGEDVDDILAEVTRTHQRVPYGIAVRVAADVAHALHHAHELRGHDGAPLSIVHRDVSPANILITYAGTVKLLDFGIAKWTGTTEHTQIGYVKGKAPYLSPEQCMQSSLDGRSDVFSLGVVLYELTTLMAPFGSTLGDDAAIIDRIIHDRYRQPGELGLDYPPELATIITRCLRPSRELRYRTAAELAADLVSLSARRGWSTSAEDLTRWLRSLFGARKPPWLDDPTTVLVGARPPQLPTEEEPTVIAPVNSGLFADPPSSGDFGGISPVTDVDDRLESPLPGRPTPARASLAVVLLVALALAVAAVGLALVGLR